MTTEMEEQLQTEKILGVLNRLNRFSPNIEASALISVDGRIMVSALAAGAEPDRFAAVCASTLALAEHASREVGRGKLRQVYLEGESGSVLLVRAGAEAVLAVTARPDINLGMLMMEARRVGQQFKEMLDWTA